MKTLCIWCYGNPECVTQMLKQQYDENIILDSTLTQCLNTFMNHHHEPPLAFHEIGAPSSQANLSSC